MTQALSSEKLSRHLSRASQDAGSNYEDMVRVLPYTHASVDCRACGGNGYLELSEQELRKFAAQIARQKTTEHRDQVRAALSRASSCQKCRGTGKVSAPRGDRSAAMDSMFTTTCCGRCRGCGEASPTDTSAERQDVCLGCGGDAYIVPVTVRCRGSSNQGGMGGASATDGDGPLMLPSAPHDLTAGTDVGGAETDGLSAKIDALRDRDPQLAAALASYDGPEGEPWVNHRWGRAFVVWQHTAAGQQLAAHVAERSPQRSGYLVPVTERLASAREAQERPGEARQSVDATLQRVLLARADREAREILRRRQTLVHTLEWVA